MQICMIKVKDRIMQKRTAGSSEQRTRKSKQIHSSCAGCTAAARCCLACAHPYSSIFFHDHEQQRQSISNSSHLGPNKPGVGSKRCHWCGCRRNCRSRDRQIRRQNLFGKPQSIGTKTHHLTGASQRHVRACYFLHPFPSSTCPLEQNNHVSTDA